MKIKQIKTEWLRVRLSKPLKKSIEKKALAEKRVLSDYVRLVLQKHTENGRRSKE